MGSAVHALRTCLFTDTHSLTESYMPDDIVGRAPYRALPTKRTMRPFATAHTFCAFRGGPRSSDFLRTVPKNSKGILVRFINTQEKKILASVTEIRRENWGKRRIFKR